MGHFLPVPFLSACSRLAYLSLSNCLCPLRVVAYCHAQACSVWQLVLSIRILPSCFVPRDSRKLSSRSYGSASANVSFPRIKNQIFFNLRRHLAPFGCFASATTLGISRLVWSPSLSKDKAVWIRSLSLTRDGILWRKRLACFWLPWLVLLPSLDASIL